MFGRLAAFWIVAWVGVVIGGAYVLVPAYAEYTATENTLRTTERNLLAQQRVNEDLKAEIFRLKTDDRTIERVARDKFNYAKPTETIYDFTPPVGPNAGEVQGGR